MTPLRALTDVEIQAGHVHSDSDLAAAPESVLFMARGDRVSFNECECWFCDARLDGFLHMEEAP